MAATRITFKNGKRIETKGNFSQLASNAPKRRHAAHEDTGVENATGSTPAKASRPGDVATPQLDIYTGTQHNAGMSRAVNATQAARQSVVPSAWGAREGHDATNVMANLLSSSGKATGNTWEDENAAARLADKRKVQVQDITGDWTGDAAAFLQGGGNVDTNTVRGLENIDRRFLGGAAGGIRNVTNYAGYAAQDAADTAKDTARAVGVNEQFAADFDKDPDAMKPFNEWKASLKPGEYEALEMNGQLPDPRTLYANAKQAEAEKAYREKNGELELKRLTDFGEGFQKETQEKYGDIEGGWKTAGDVAETIGQQAPAMALRAIPGAGAALSTAYLFGSAAGGATEDALAHGAKAEDALSYGTMNGIMEAATERMFDGMSGLLGKGAADEAVESLVSKIGNTGVRNLARWGLGAAGEGAEELVSAIADPALRTIYNNKDLAESYKANLDWGDVLYQGMMGALTGGVMGTVGFINGQYRAKNDSIEARLAAQVANNIAADPQAQQVIEQAQSNATSELNATEATVSTNPAEVMAGLGQTANEAQTGAQSAVQEAPASRKQQQYDLIAQSNPMRDDIHTGIRSADEVRTFQEALADDGIGEGDAGMTPDVTADMIKQALETGQITVYSSKPIEEGGFVTPSRMEAQSYAGDGQVYSQTVNLDDVAWIDSNQGQYAPVPEQAQAQAEPLTPLAQTVLGEQAQTPAEETTTPLAQAILGEQAQPEQTSGKRTLGIRPAQNVMEETKGAMPSQTVETAQATEATTDEFSELIDQTKEKGGFRYMPLSNNESTQRAAEKIKGQGWAPALTAWSNDVQRGMSGAEMTAMGALLYNNAVNSGDTKLAMQILSDYAMLGRNTAQGLQAFQILKSLSPDNQLYAIENQLAKLSEQLKGKLPEGVKLSEELKEAYQKAESDEARDAVLDQMMQDVADQIPSTFKDKWTALRYMNMLGNFRTQGRNIIGNFLMALTTNTKNGVLRLLEGAAKVATKGRYERSISLKVDPELRKQAMQEFKENERFISGESKYADNTFTGNEFMQGVQDKRRIFSFAPAEGYRKATTFATQKGDTLFIGPRYARSLAGYLQANGIDAQTFAGIRDGSIQATPEQAALLERARNFAMKEAQEATFHDSNVLSDWISKVGRRPGTPGFARVLGEGIMPFRKTPANVAVRMAEYSPLGLVDAAYKTIRSQTNGDVSANDILNTAAKGLTGTGMFILGMLLRSAGRLRGHEDDDKQSSFDDLRGQQDYSLILDDGTSITVDWASPVAATVFMGSQMYDLIQEGGFQLEDLGEMFTRLSDPLIKMSMLQGVNDTIDSLRHAENGLGQVALNMGMSYLTQGLTNSLLGQAERISEDRRYSTFRDSNTPFGRNIQQTLGKMSAKTPGLDYNQIEYVDAWGRTEDTGTTFERAINNLINPGYVSHDTSTAVDDELQRLYDSGFGSVFPTRRGMSEKISTYDEHGKLNGERALTADEYVKYQKVKGQTSLKMMRSLMSSQVYETMSDDAKASAIAEIYKYAGNQAAMSVEPSTKNAYKEVSKLSNPAAYYGAKAAFDDAASDRYDRDYETVESLIGDVGSLPKDVRTYLFEKEPELEKVSQAYRSGCPVRTYYQVADAVKDIKPLTGASGAKNWQVFQAVLDNTKTTKQADILMQTYMQDGTYQRYQTARSAGVTPRFFTQAYKVYTDNNNRKGDFTDWMKKQGYSKTDADYMYAVLHGKLADLSGLNAKYKKKG